MEKTEHERLVKLAFVKELRRLAALLPSAKVLKLIEEAGRYVHAEKAKDESEVVAEDVPSRARR